MQKKRTFSTTKTENNCSNFVEVMTSYGLIFMDHTHAYYTVYTYWKEKGIVRGITTLALLSPENKAIQLAL